MKRWKLWEISEGLLVTDSPDMIPMDLWRVTGIDGVYYGTKMQAEVEARKAFPDEPESRRYARVFFKTFYMEV